MTAARKGRLRVGTVLAGVGMAIAAGGPLGAKRLRAAENPNAGLDAILKWQSLGPDRGGRVTTVAGVPPHPFRFYAGTVGGGVWRTDDAGSSWNRVDTRVFGSASVGAIAVAPSAPETIYVGMGESTQRMYMSTIGDGLYKSVDGGATWTKLGMDETRRVGAIVVHPANPDLVYVAAMGQSWVKSETRGVYRSRDGGTKWEKVLYVSDTASAVSLSMDAHDPNVLYAAMWDNLRSPWYLGSGGPGSGIYKSVDAGDHWRKLERGLPSLMGKIGISVSPVDSRRVYANVEAKLEEGGLYVSSDAGESWAHVNGNINLWSRGWYYVHVFADPTKLDRVWVNCTEFWRSDDGGKTFQAVANHHGDNHAVWINPHSPEIMVQGNDGGASVSLDGGATWSTLLNQRTGQFWHVAVDDRVPYTVFGAQQDRGTVAIRSREDLGGPAGRHIHEAGGGEGGYVAVDPFEPDLIYAGSELGFISRFDRRTGLATTINPYPLFPEGTEPRNLKYRFHVDAPILASRHSEGVIYHAGNVVFRSRDRGQSWQPISPDLTRNEVDKQGKAGGPLTNEIIDAYNTITTLDESPLDGTVLWAGTNDGRLQVTSDGGATWHDVTPPGVGDGEFYTVTASPSNRAGAYAALTRHRLGDMRPHLFRTADLGRSWATVSDALPQSTYARVLREDPKTPALLYAGTERGVYVSFDSGVLWRELSATLPTVSVTGLVTAGNGANDLVISTEGSAFWILEGLTTLRQVGAAAPHAMQLYAPPPAYIIEGVTAPCLDCSRGFAHSGLPIDLFLTDAQVREPRTVVLQIVDGEGTVLASLLPETGSPKQKFHLRPGVNRIYWDFHRDTTPVLVQGALDGQLDRVGVPAGRYTVRLTAGGFTEQQAITLQWSPLGPPPPPSAVAERHALLRRIEAVFRDVAETVNAAAAERTALKRSAVGTEQDHARALADWEGRVFDRRLVYEQSRVDYGGGLLFDLKMLHAYTATSQSPMDSAMATTAEELTARWQVIKSARP